MKRICVGVIGSLLAIAPFIWIGVVTVKYEGWDVFFGVASLVLGIVFCTIFGTVLITYAVTGGDDK